MFIFRKMMYSQNDETGILRDARNQNFLCCPTMVGRLLEKFLKIISVDYTLC